MPVYEDKNIKTNPFYFAFEVKDTNGKRKTIKERGFKSRRQAEIAEDGARKSWKAGTHIDPSSMTYGEYINNWVEKRGGLSKQTRYNYKSQIKKHVIPYLGNIKMSDLDADTIEDFITSLQKTNLVDSTIRKVFNIVNASLDSAVKKEKLTRNPVILLDSKPTVSKKKVDYWSINEVKTFLNGFEHRQKIIFQLAIHTGMRMGEILGLSIDDMDLENRQIRIRQVLDFKAEVKQGTKTASGNRSIKIPKSLFNDVKNQIDKMENEIKNGGEGYNKDRLFVCTNYGRPVAKANITKTWKYLLKKTGVRPIRFHDLRHTCATLLLQLKENPKIVQELLGHSSVKITLEIYSHVIPGMSGRAVDTLDKYITESEEEEILEESSKKGED